MVFETDKWPFIPARWFTFVSKPRKVNYIVIHAMQAPEKGETAEAVGRYLQTVSRPASAHIGVDNNSIVQYVKDNNVAYGAPYVNHNGIQIELAGYAAQTEKEWLDDYGKQMLDLASNAAAQYALKYDVPIKHLSLKELADRKRGFIAHWDATQVLKPNAGHTDPGLNFPWTYFLEQVTKHYAERKARLST
jgi:N-acetyl-anhydromuramyl-L-alanine amidase AmpD